jgi:hypothetical protein
MAKSRPAIRRIEAPSSIETTLVSTKALTYSFGTNNLKVAEAETKAKAPTMRVKSNRMNRKLEIQK